MKTKIGLVLSVILLFLLPSPVSPAYNQGKGGENPEKLAISLPVVSGVLWNFDEKQQLVSVALDKKGRVLETIPWASVRSVYLIQGKPESLYKYLKYGAIGGGAGFSTSFWRKLIPEDSSNGKNVESYPNLTKIFIYSSAGMAAGLLAGWFKERGEEVRTFPIYDPEIRQSGDRPAGWLDYSEIKNVERLIFKESFVVVTKKG